MLTQEQRICRIEPQISCEKAFVFDAAGKIITPGLVDAHTHLSGISTDKCGTTAQASCFPFGVTAAVDAGAEYGSPALLDSLGVKSGQWGCLEAGKTADIAVLDYTDEGFSLTDKAGNTLKSATGYRCLLTVCDGQVIHRY